MQKGSLVECSLDFPAMLNCTMPKKGEIYTIRSLYKINGRVCIRLCEIRNKVRIYNDGPKDGGFDSFFFGEVQPPIDISALFADQLKVSQ